MAIAAIHAWLLADGPYDQGLALLQRYGSLTAPEIAFYRLPESNAGRKRMRRQLQGLHDASDKRVDQVHVATAAIAQAQKPAPPPEVEERAFSRSTLPEPPADLTEDQLPEELRPLRRNLTEKHKQRLVLRGMLIKTVDGMELRELAESIEEISKAIRDGWRRIELWRTTGTVMLQRTALPDLAEAQVERQRIRTWISQRKSGGRRYTPQQMEAKTARLAELDKLIADATA